MVSRSTLAVIGAAIAGGGAFVIYNNYQGLVLANGGPYTSSSGSSGFWAWLTSGMPQTWSTGGGGGGGTTYTPSISVSPMTVSGAPIYVTVTGSGFPPNSDNIAVYVTIGGGTPMSILTGIGSTNAGDVSITGTDLQLPVTYTAPSYGIYLSTSNATSNTVAVTNANYAPGGGGGGPPTLKASGSAVIGGTVTFSVSGLAPNSSYLLFWYPAGGLPVANILTFNNQPLDANGSDTLPYMVGQSSELEAAVAANPFTGIKVYAQDVAGTKTNEVTVT